MKIKRKRWKNVAAAMLLLCVVLTGCGMSGERNIKLRDLDFTVLSEEKIPEELKTVIAEKGSEPFRLTYSDNQNLYISIGYGEQKTGGYSIAVDELYLTDDAVHVSTSLLGPDITGQKSGAGKPTTPYIVIKTELLDKTVISEEKIPEELKTVIAEKGSEPFRLTYSDNQNLYISIGYGEQKTGGYSIAVDELYLTDDAVHVSTSLLGPDITGQKSGAGKPTTPYIVIKTELLDKTVIYD